MLSDEQIELYLSNNLSLQDKRRVENELAQDRALSARVEDYRVLTEAICSSAWMRWEALMGDAGTGGLDAAGGARGARRFIFDNLGGLAAPTGPEIAELPPGLGEF